MSEGKKKKLIFFVACAIISIVLVGLGVRIGSSKYSSHVKESIYNDLEAKYAKLGKENETIKSQYDEECRKYFSVKTAFDNYQEKMKPYEGLEASEAAAKKIEADRVAAEEKAAAEQAAAEAEEAKKAEEAVAAAAKAEEEARGYETGITYEQLARTPDDFKGQKVKFTGKVIQVLEGDGEVEIRLNVDDDYNKTIYCAYKSNIVSERVLDNDVITIYGVSAGLLSYKSTMGGTITIPSILVDKIER